AVKWSTVNADQERAGDVDWHNHDCVGIGGSDRGRSCAWRPKSGGRYDVRGIVAMVDIGYHAIGRSANRQKPRHTGDWAQNVIYYCNVRQHYLARVGNGDPIAEGGTVGAYPHAGGELLSVQVGIERFASGWSIANDLFVNLNRR